MGEIRLRSVGRNPWALPWERRREERIAEEVRATFTRRARPEQAAPAEADGRPDAPRMQDQAVVETEAKQGNGLADRVATTESRIDEHEKTSAATRWPDFGNQHHLRTNFRTSETVLTGKLPKLKPLGTPLHPHASIDHRLAFSTPGFADLTEASHSLLNQVLQGLKHYVTPGPLWQPITWEAASHMTRWPLYDHVESFRIPVHDGFDALLLHSTAPAAHEGATSIFRNHTEIVVIAFPDAALESSADEAAGASHDWASGDNPERFQRQP